MYPHGPATYFMVSWPGPCLRHVQWPDVFGRLPLFWALRRGVSVKVFELLYIAHPPALREMDFGGEAPLDLLFHPSKDASYLAQVLEHDPSLAMTTAFPAKDVLSKTPLILRLCATMSMKRICASSLATGSLPPQQRRQPVVGLGNINTSNNTNGEEDAQTWKRFLLTLRAAYRHEFIGSEDSRPLSSVPELHMALQLHLPALALQHFCHLYPKQVSIPMVLRQRRRTAAATRQTTSLQEMWPLDYILTNPTFVQTAKSMTRISSVIRGMIQVFPDAVKQPISILPSSKLHDEDWEDEGRNFGTPFERDQRHDNEALLIWPLHAALRSGYTWSTGIREMTTLAPEILHQQAEESPLVTTNQLQLPGRDHRARCRSRTGELPWHAFQVAATRHCTTRETSSTILKNRGNVTRTMTNPDLDTIYQLLRERPSVKS